MDEQQFQNELASQVLLKQEALSVTQFIPGLSIDDKKARFPGFRQRTVIYKAGHVAEPGALPLPETIVMHESVSMQLRDGTQLYTDIFLPSRFKELDADFVDPVPAIVAWSPYGKQKGSQILDDVPLRAGVPRNHVSGLQKFEGPDPAFWCPRGYAVVNVDTRGAYTSEGDLLIFGHQEAEDGADFVTWVSRQSWCNGKVALSGNSWLAIAQWRIASMRPEGLAAIAPWEGFTDFYRHTIYVGGILMAGFHDSIIKTFATQTRIEDISSYARKHGLVDAYFLDKRAHPERINVPVYAVASWTNPGHTVGTFEAWEALPDSLPKWLRVHNTQEWSDYYSDPAQKDLQRFFDHYLKGQTENGWLSTPKVRLSVLHLGLTGLEDTTNRAEASFPLERATYTKLFLQADNTLNTNPSTKESLLSYDSTSGNLTFLYEVPSACETTGYFMAHLVMSSTEHHEMDVFVQVEKLSPDRKRQAVMTFKPMSAVIRRLLKFMHDWDILPGSAGMAFHRGPCGCLRASHALDKDTALSRPERPAYLHTRTVPLQKGQPRSLDIPMQPYGMFWEKGDILRLTIQGSAVIPFPLPGLEMHITDNKGLHVLHCGGKGQDSSFLSIPIV